MDAEQKLIDALESQIIAPVVLKGASAAQYYDLPESRTFGDVDLLIAKEAEFNSAIREILKHGYLPMADYGEMSAILRHMMGHCFFAGMSRDIRVKDSPPAKNQRRIYSYKICRRIRINFV